MLSRRQNQVCERLLQGKTDKEIAQELAISEETVAYHLRRVYTKFGVTSRAEAKLIFSRQNALLAA
jgi:DNA-binding CsgD family transcriptional regulator